MGGGAFSLVVDSGSVALAGTAATLKTGRLLAATGGTLTFTGTAATLKVGRVLAAVSGGYGLTGTDATLIYMPSGASPATRLLLMGVG